MCIEAYPVTRTNNGEFTKYTQSMAKNLTEMWDQMRYMYPCRGLQQSSHKSVQEMGNML